MPTSPTDSTTVEPQPLDDPSFPPPDDAVPTEPVEDVEEELEAPEATPPEPPHESREAQLARENAEYRALLLQMQGQLQQQHARPVTTQPDDPLAPMLQGIPPEQQQAWRESFKVLNPYIQRQMQAMVEPLQNQLRQNATVSESLALSQRYPQYGAVASQIEQARWQEYQQTGIWHPLERVYAVALGAQQLQQPQVQRVARQTERRKTAGRAAAATTAETQGTRLPAPKRTVDQTLAMTDEQILNMAEQNGGIERLRLPTRKRA